jgi:hypothetical protein
MVEDKPSYSSEEIVSTGWFQVKDCSSPRRETDPFRGVQDCGCSGSRSISVGARLQT